MDPQTAIKPRQRAPGKRALRTREAILDAAEYLFSERGFDGASIRDIAARAEVPVGLVSHHGGSKEKLFFTVIARRADELARLRMEALSTCLESGRTELRDIIACFVLPFLHLTYHGPAQWRAYGRLVAIASADERWRVITQACFDPTVNVFLDRIAGIVPDASRKAIASSFVFMVSSMLAICASRWRIEALSGQQNIETLDECLLDFCEAGFIANLGRDTSDVRTGDEREMTRRRE